MHISEGILSGPVLVTGAALAVSGVAIGLRSVKEEDVPRVALMSATFFLASLIHVPLGPSNVHLILNGVTGLILGWAAFPAILVGLLLHAVLFQFGGLTTLGVNTFIMAAPAVLMGLTFRHVILHGSSVTSTVAAALCGGLSVLLSGLLVALALVFSEEAFLKTAKLIVLAHVPIMVIEAFITAACMRFILKVKPEIMGVTNKL